MLEHYFTWLKEVLSVSVREFLEQELGFFEGSPLPHQAVAGGAYD